jgi:hypothetical protein
MSVWVRNSKGRLETFEALFESLFDTPISSPTSSIMAKEKGVQPEAPRMTMYQLLHPTQSSIPSCIMFPPNASCGDQTKANGHTSRFQGIGE